MLTRKLARARWIAITLLLVALVSVLYPQSGVSVDEIQIQKLLSDISDRAIKPNDVLDPSLGQDRRERALAYLTDPYQLHLTPTGPIQIQANVSAAVPVKVDFKNATTEMSADSTARFIKRNGVWYYADFDFLGFPTVILVTLLICGSVGVGYATTVLVLRWRLARQGMLTWGNRVKLFIPIFWPRLFRAKQAVNSTN